MKKLIAAALLGLFSVLLFAVPAAAITPGAFCDDKWDTEQHNGKTYICATKAPDTKFRWRPIGEADPKPVGSKSASASASSSASASASPSSASNTVAPSSSTTPNQASSLPLTGAPVPVVLGIGGVALLAGVGLFFAARRRTRFTT